MIIQKEKVKLLNGEETEIEIKTLIISVIKRLKALYLKVHKIVPEGTTGIKSMEGTFDYETLSFEIVKAGIKPFNIDELDPEECDRLYNKFYARYVNPQGSKEEKKS